MNIQYEINTYNFEYRLQLRSKFLSAYKNAVVKLAPRFLFFNKNKQT